MNRPLRWLLPICVTLFVALLPAITRADPMDPKAVPEPLKPWVGWALDGRSPCAFFQGRGDLTRCVWPSRVDLVLEEKGGRFTQKWRVDEPRVTIALPGDAKRWPEDVKVGGARALVFEKDGPKLELGQGEHVVTGAFAWDTLPESIRVPQETGLVALSIRGKTVASPNRDAQGTVWLQKTRAAGEEGDALELVVHRKITDDIPLALSTRIELHVSGKNREILTGRALPAGFIPTSLDSPLPARVEPDGRLRVQARPGVYNLMLVARSEGPVRALSRPAPDGPWREGEEVWVFEARNDYRVVTVEGAVSIDPQQTTLPDAWKSLPAYPIKLQDTLRLTEKRRGDAEPPPNQLTLTRALWLDFDGAGYTAHDTLTGTLNRDSRLTMSRPTSGADVLSHDPQVGVRYTHDPLVHFKASARFYVELRGRFTQLPQALPRLKIPVLLLQAGDDRIASAEATARLFPDIGSDQKKLIIYDGYYHEILNEVDRDVVFQDLVGWLRSAGCAE